MFKRTDEVYHNELVVRLHVLRNGRKGKEVNRAGARGRP